MAHFTIDQRKFLILSLAHKMSMPAIISDFQEVYPGVCDDDDKLLERLKKLKMKHAPEIEAIAEKLKSDVPVFALPEWRIFYFRRLLSESKSPDMKVKLLREIRSESKLFVGEPATTSLPEPTEEPKLVSGSGADLWGERHADPADEGSGEEDTTADGEV